MCNNYGVTVSWTDYVDGLAQQGMTLSSPEGAPNLAPQDSIWPTDTAPPIRPGSDGVGLELVKMRWGFRPPHAKAGPIINYRSEGRRFGPGRCLAPASWFFEYTGTKSPKSRWKFTRTGADWFCIAALWRAGDGMWPDSFTLLTLTPGPDVARLHQRQIAILEPDQWGAWVDPRVPAESLLGPSPEGSLTAEQVR
jgi:putative SOS response-associated peptidase YedK